MQAKLRNLNVRLPEELYQELKVYSAHSASTVQDTVQAALRRLLSATCEPSSPGLPTLRGSLKGSRLFESRGEERARELAKDDGLLR